MKCDKLSDEFWLVLVVVVTIGCGLVAGSKADLIAEEAALVRQADEFHANRLADLKRRLDARSAGRPCKCGAPCCRDAGGGR